MRIGLIDSTDGPQVAIQRGEQWLAAAPAGRGLTDLLKSDTPLHTDGREVRGELLAPITPGKIVAIGLNYKDHIREANMETPKEPLVFTKFTSSITGTNQPVIVDESRTQRVDWEVELAVVIGKTARNVSAEEALEYVFGYTIANDVSARDMQFGDGQWVRGKSQDTFCPVGPVIVTPDELDDPSNLRLATRVNGTTMQDSTTAELLFDIKELIAYCSENFTLEPGDLLLTGTPWGCGEFMSPPQHLHPGDVVECEIEGIGVLKNPVVAP